MQLFFILSTLLTMSINCAFARIPADDFRTDRAEFMASFIKDGDVGAEIGVDHGTFSYHVLLQNNPSKLYLIDAWQYGLQTDVDTGPMEENQKKREAVYMSVCEIFAPFENVEIIRKKSEEAVLAFPDEYFDYVYVNGIHSYENVKNDLNNYFPKLKVGGYIIGDNYGWTGVAKAITEFLSVHEEDTFWLDDPYNGMTAAQFLIQRLK